MRKRTAGSGIGRLAGKVTWSEADAREVLAAQAASGESVAAFCRRAGIGGARLGWWRKRLNERAPAAGGPALLRVRVRGQAPHEARHGVAIVEIVVAGRVVRVPPGFDLEELRRVVSALE